MNKLPEQLVLMRHGRTNANDVYSARRKGIVCNPDIEKQVESQADWQHTLNEKGVEQARLAKEWIDRHLGGIAAFGAFFTSPYIRTRQTAAIISEGTDIRWRIDDMLSEQGYGGPENMEALKSIKTNIIKKMGEKSLWSFYFNGGENHMQLHNRFDSFMERRLAGHGFDSALIVAHTGLINVARYHIESWLPEAYDAQEVSETDKITNGSLLLYSRKNPDNPDDIRNAYHWGKLVYPYPETILTEEGQWYEFDPSPTYSSQDLLDQSSFFNQ